MAYGDWMKGRHEAGLPAPYAEYKAIVKKQRDEYYAELKAKKKPKEKANKTIGEFAANLLQRTKNRANAKDWQFDLDIDWLMERMNMGKCQVTGIDFGIGGEKSPWQPSIDRIDSNRGYTKDNCQLVVWIYNRSKSDGTHDVVMIMARALVR